ncbi:MAG: hypothetical protein ACHP6H_04285 [Legionellales bacterium]
MFTIENSSSNTEMKVFVIDGNTTKEDLIEFIKFLSSRVSESKEKIERNFLGNILEKAQLCLNNLVEGNSFATTTIPIEEKQESYANECMGKFSLVHQFNRITAIRNELNRDSTLKDPEKTILLALCNDLRKELFAAINHPPEKFNLTVFQEGIESKFQKVQKEAEESAGNTPVISAFKEAINKICNLFNIEPIYALQSESTKSTESSDRIKKINGIKVQLLDIIPTPDTDPDSSCNLES